MFETGDKVIHRKTGNVYTIEKMEYDNTFDDYKLYFGDWEGHDNYYWGEDFLYKKEFRNKNLKALLSNLK